ncbi:hypothetical protein CRYUN_Cryun24cG0084200 [Craigia yunnanensis]
MGLWKMAEELEENAERIGLKIGVLKDMDESLETGGRARFLRIRVEVDITKPLKRVVMLAGGGGKREIWAQLCFERLLTFCYECGILGHSDIKCGTKKEGEGTAAQIKQYGNWLRASPLKKTYGVVGNFKSVLKSEGIMAKLQSEADKEQKGGPKAEVFGGGPARRLNLEVNLHEDSMRETRDLPDKVTGSTR